MIISKSEISSNNVRNKNKYLFYFTEKKNKKYLKAETKGKIENITKSLV